MQLYESSEHNQTGAFFRLVRTLRETKEGKRGFSAFIGAGCSLSSSQEDISTPRILERCIRENYNPDFRFDNNDPWVNLYSTFVNSVWEPSAEFDRLEILSKYFVGLKPAKGYVFLRKLADAGFITDIITTNFDMLINEAFEDLAYFVQVGALPPRAIKGGSNIRLYKVHGDIESGHLRFSPRELERLPKSIAKIVRASSKNPMLFCGYRGQDRGVMSCLDASVGYNVFWSSPRKPPKEDVFENGPIYEWLSSRSSENNFIYGDEFGTFDSLMEQLYKHLIEDSKSYVVVNIASWSKNTISDAIQINSRVHSIFISLLRCSETLRSEYEWNVKYPFYSKDYKTTLNAYLYYFRESTSLPTGLLQTPENEIEALLMGLAIEIQASTSGLNTMPTEYAIKLKQQYESTNPEYMPDTSFWDGLLSIMSSLQSNSPLGDNKGLVDIKLHMNNRGRMTLSVREPNLIYIADTIALLSVSGLFVPTCSHDAKIDRIGASKILLQTHSEDISTSDDMLCFRLSNVTKCELADIYDAFFSHLNGYTLDDENCIIGPKVMIVPELKESSKSHESFSLVDHLYSLSASYTKTYLKLRSAFEIDSDDYIHDTLVDEIDRFIESTKIGMFVIGSSGSGKTKSIQHFTRYGGKDDKIIAVASPKSCSFEGNIGLSVFWDQITTFDDESQFCSEISLTVKARRKKLVLIVDGLNEIDGGMDVCVQHYKRITSTISLLQDAEIDNIKIIVTCRDYAFLDYCERSLMYPSAELCYCHFEGDSVTPYYQMKPLTLEQQLKFTDLYFSDKKSRTLFEINLRSNPYFQQTFDQPYLIALAGRYHNSSVEVSTVVSIQDTFSNFAEQMLSRLDSISSISISRSVIDVYFDLLINTEHFGRRITPFILLNHFAPGAERNQAAQALKSLCDINVLSGTHSNEYIRFTHDRIEEYFLSEYMYARGTDFKILNRVAQIAPYDPIFNSSTMSYFRKLSLQRHYSQYIDNCDMLYETNMGVLSQAIASSLDTFSKQSYKDAFSCAERSRLGLSMFLTILLEGVRHAISRSDTDFPEPLIHYFDELSSIFTEVERHSKHFYYITSMYYLHKRGNSSLAEYYCDLAFTKPNEKEHLDKLLDLLKAVIDKNNGLLDVAIEKFMHVFTYFDGNNYHGSAAECALEWGGSLRQKTMFEEAITVYDKINLANLSDNPSLIMKLHRKKGIAYKNIMQRQLRELRSGNVGDDLLKSLAESYSNAQAELTSAIKINPYTLDTIEKMYIMEEQATTALHYSDIDRNHLVRAKFILDDVDRMLASFPVPDVQIIHMRHVAAYNESIGNLEEALDILENARSIATSHVNTYRLFEVDYQIGRLVERYKDSLDKKYWLVGLNALKNALNKELDDNNQYRSNCEKSYALLAEYIATHK